MSMKPAVIYALSLTLGLAAVTHAKTLLIEQLPQDTTENQKLVYRTDRPLYESDWIKLHQTRTSISYVLERWSQWTV